MSWEKHFFDPIALPDGRALRTLRDAGEYIQALPKARQKAREWQTACEALLVVVQHRGDPMHARMAFMSALNAGKPKPPLRPASTDPHWGRRPLARER